MATSTDKIHTSIVNTNVLGFAFTLLSALYLIVTVGGATGRTIVMFAALPLFFLFRWATEPLVHMISGEEKYEEEEIEDLSPELLSDLKKEHIAATVKKIHHEDIHARIDGDDWVCACGTRNHMDQSVKIQNCTHCFRNRDYVLRNYMEHAARLEEKSNKLADAIKHLDAA